MLHGRTRNDLKPYPDGSVSRSYWCNRSAGGCGKTEIDQRALAATIPALVIEILADPGNTGEIETAAREIASVRATTITGGPMTSLLGAFLGSRQQAPCLSVAEFLLQVAAQVAAEYRRQPTGSPTVRRR